MADAPPVVQPKDRWASMTRQRAEALMATGLTQELADLRAAGAEATIEIEDLAGGAACLLLRVVAEGHPTRESMCPSRESGSNFLESVLGLIRGRAPTVR
jgi:hypothetical protein